MADPLYFQWQNEVLLKTIYPLREKKLRDFLVYFAEIDIWGQYKDKTPGDLADEIKQYHEGQAQLILEAYRHYATWRDYFLIPDVRAEYAAQFNPLDEEELTQINKLHATFIRYLPNTLKKGSARNFVSGQEGLWVNHRQDVRRLTDLQKRRVEAIAPDHPKRPAEIEKLKLMQHATSGMVDEELIKLRAFIKALAKIEPRQQTLIKAQATGGWRKNAIDRKLLPLRDKFATLSANFKTLEDNLLRLKNPPDLAASQAWFSTADLAAQIRVQFPQADDVFLTKLKGFRQAMLEEQGNLHNPNVKLRSLKNFSAKWNTERKTMEREAETLAKALASMPADQPKRAEREARLKQLRETQIPALEQEINQLGDLCIALELSFTPKAEADKVMAVKEQEKAKAEKNLSAAKGEIGALETELASVEATLNADEEKYLTEYVSTAEVTNRDIARLKVEQYQNSLTGKGQYELLEEIVQRFIQNPQRFPLWLQYMTVHFSGMRYKSAHGSWADPRDFLVRWHSLHVEKEFGLPDHATVEQHCKEKVAQYEGDQAPALAHTTDKKWQSKRDNNLNGMKTGGPKTRRAAILALLTDEIAYDFRQLSDADVLNRLLGMKDQFPGWLWKELLMVTNLKVNLVNDLNWEKLTREEEAEKGAVKSGELRELVNKWRESYTTGWREEHARSHRLIVTRAVCNETAEHCQHLRGHNPPGGLTAKAPWYLKNENAGNLPGNPLPYFMKPRNVEDFTTGASILWVRFVEEEYSPWRVANPLVTKGGDTLLAPELRGQSPAGWTYQEAEIVKRKRSSVDENQNPVDQEQWLRWIHEATVAEVGETAEGPVVLTYETALPDDDPGQAAIGLFKLSQSFALGDGAEDNYHRAFVGYLPEGQLPVEHLEEMLDWNKILRREVLPPAEMEAWREKYIRSQRAKA